MSNLTWKAVFLIWLLALPILGGVGFIAYRQYPAPFHVAWKYAQQGYNSGMKAYQDHQAKEAAKKKAEEAKKKAAQEAQGGGWN